MPLEKRIALLPFRYNVQGEFREADAVIVSETTFRQSDLDARITAAVMKAVQSLSKGLEGMSSDAAPADDDVNSDEQLMRMLAMGYDDGDAFAQFFKQIRHALTNNAALCRVADTDAPLSQQAWDSIGETNGIDGWYRICSVFLSFFFERLQSNAANGNVRSIGSASPTMEVLPDPRRAGFRGAN